LAKVQFSELWPQLMGLVPVYTRDGVNGTSILLEKNPALFCEVKTKTMLGRLCRTFLIDLRLAHRAYSHICGRRYAVPISLRPGLVMVPVRARTARVKDDGTRAYLVKDKIRKYLPEDRRSNMSGTRIVFVNDTSIVVPHRWSNVREVMVAAELVEREGVKLNGYLVDRIGCEVRENPDSYCCKKCPRRDLCYPEEEE
jgi:hypothetical protein